MLSRKKKVTPFGTLGNTCSSDEMSRVLAVRPQIVKEGSTVASTHILSESYGSGGERGSTGVGSSVGMGGNVLP